MKEIYFGLDFASGPSRTIIAIYGMRHSKTYLMRWWQQLYRPDLLSRELIRKLAAEAVINVSLNS